MERKITVGAYTVQLQEGERQDAIVYLHCPKEEVTEIWQRLSRPRPLLATIDGIVWERELSPCPARRAFRGGADFSGGAPAYLPVLTERIVPAVEQTLSVAPRIRAIAGYSLAGLFAVWAACRTPLFSRAASVSGSLWFDGFLPALEQAIPILPERIFFSVGDREKNAKDARLATVEQCTERAAALFSERGVQTCCIKNPGGHFADAAVRTAAGIDWLVASKAPSR